MEESINNGNLVKRKADFTGAVLDALAVKSEMEASGYVDAQGPGIDRDP